MSRDCFLGIGRVGVEDGLDSIVVGTGGQLNALGVFL